MNTRPASPAPKKRFEGLRSFLYAVLIALVFRSLAYEPFHIPSGSMLNTLEVGDYIFVSKFSYGYSKFSFPFGLPLFEGRIWETPPERGDIAVFRLPTDTSTDYIKRVIGLPGDTVQVIDGIVHINHQALSTTRVEDARFEDDYGNVKTVAQYKETLPNGRSHFVLDETRNGDVDFTRPMIVPKGHYFMMGDNRDNSVDSRYTQQVGFVPIENFVGRAEVIAFSYRSGVNLWEFWRWDALFRAGRFWKDLG
jgi:signal peptidase I